MQNHQGGSVGTLLGAAFVFWQPCGCVHPLGAHETGWRGLSVAHAGRARCWASWVCDQGESQEVPHSRPCFLRNQGAMKGIGRLSRGWGGLS